MFNFPFTDSLVPDVTIEDILIFVTGASAIPSLVFEPNPTIRFVEWKCLPFASSCDNVLNFPRTLVDCNNFKEKMMLYMVLMALVLFDYQLFFVIMYHWSFVVFCTCWVSWITNCSTFTQYSS